ncbi:efflux RND transporter periplasmic adaptor subunit [soil metagenome]
MGPLGRRLATLSLFLALGAECKKKEPTVEVAPKAEADVVMTAEAVKSAGVQVAPVKSAPRRTSVIAAGIVEFSPSRVARIGPVVDGRIVTLKVDPGQRVRAGEMLAAMQSVEVGQARADYLAAQVHRTQANRERQRQEMLADGGATSTRDLLASQTATELADLEARTALERLRAVGGYAADLDRDGGGGTPSSAIALTTPLAGVVLDVNARVGQPVSPSDTLFVVGEIDRVWLVVDVYERDLAKVHGGDVVHASVPAYPSRVFDGRVDYVGGVVDPVRRAVAARIVIDNPDTVPRPGMSVNARVLHEDAADADAGTTLWIPTSALTTIDGQPFCFIEKKPGMYELRALQKGDEVEGQVEIKKGLSEGEPIVIEGTFILKSELLKEQMGKND